MLAREGRPIPFVEEMIRRGYSEQEAKRQEAFWRHLNVKTVGIDGKTLTISEPEVKK